MEDQSFFNTLCLQSITMHLKVMHAIVFAFECGKVVTSRFVVVTVLRLNFHSRNSHLPLWDRPKTRYHRKGDNLDCIFYIQLYLEASPRRRQLEEDVTKYVTFRNFFGFGYYHPSQAAS